LTNDHTTLTELLARAAEHGDVGLRIVDASEQASWYGWPDVYERALAACGRMQAYGVGPGDRVALVLPTSIEFFDAFFGVLLAGAVPVPLYPPVRLGRLDEYAKRTARMLELVRARLVITGGRVRRLLGQAVEPARPRLGCATLDELPRGSARPAAVGWGDLALVQFSSGTTVDPKPVALSQRAVVAQTVRLNRFWPQPDDRTVDSGVSWLPLYHDMGLIGCVFPALEHPGTLTLIPPELFVARPAVWLRPISRSGGTLSPAPNFAYGLCVDRVRDEELAGVDLSRWRVALNGAEPVAPRVLREFADRFARWGFRPEAMTPVYGLSEAALAVTFSEIGSPPCSRRFDRDRLALEGRAQEAADGVEMVAVGRPLPDFELRVVGADGGGLDEDRVGRILVRGPSLMDGYLDQPEATDAALRNGWLDTGDLGFIHDGQLYLTGRAKDVLILRGRNHSPHEVEDAVYSVDGVRTGCAVAVSFLSEDDVGERLLLLVEARRDLPEGEYSRLAADCAAAVRAAAALDPDRVEVLAPGTLPRTSSGKLRRAEALRRWQGGGLRPPDAVTPMRLVGAMARSSAAFVRMRWHLNGRR
jgi:acyl-CoA synthetase (AMP-forming)/AMP-acid ligase II